MKLLYSTIQQIENYCNEYDIPHRFVGGVSYAGLLNPETTYNLDLPAKTIQFSNHNPLELIRADGSVKDIDMIIFTPDEKKVIGLHTFVAGLRKQALEANDLFPDVSIEATIYPSLGTRNALLQFVTALEVDTNATFGDGNIYFAFDDLKQTISWKSLEGWTIYLQNGTHYTVRNPIADYLAYHFRSPSGLKPKDKEKVLRLKQLADEVMELGKEQGIEYDSKDYYQPWKRYTDRLTHRTGLTGVKAVIMRVYWATIGTTLAHGKGFIGSILTKFANQFTGIKQ